MSDAQHGLITEWRSCAVTKPPYVTPADLEVIRKHPKIISECTSFKSYIQSSEFGVSSDDKKYARLLHFHQLPCPYLGNLAKASIFLLMLNPGLDAGGYYAEENSVSFRKALIRNIRQDNASDAFPLMALDPTFSWTTGGIWLQSKLRGVAQKIAESHGINIVQTYQLLSRHMATLELYPYHSKSFSLPAAMKRDLPSTKLMRQYVKEVVMAKAHAGKAWVIVTRQVSAWQLEDDNPKNDEQPGAPFIVKYESAHARGAHLSPESAGGAAIIRAMNQILDEEE